MENLDLIKEMAENVKGFAGQIEDVKSSVSVVKDEMQKQIDVAFAQKKTAASKEVKFFDELVSEKMKEFNIVERDEPTGELLPVHMNIKLDETVHKTLKRLLEESLYIAFIEAFAELQTILNLVKLASKNVTNPSTETWMFGTTSTLFVL